VHDVRSSTFEVEESVIDYARLIGQFVVSGGESRAPREWVSERIGDWYLGRHPALPAMRLLGVEGRPVGWMLGYPISEAGTLLADGGAVRVPAQALVSAEALEGFIYSFGGRFAVVVLDGHPRFYLDPCGSLSAVYCTHQRMVVSTPNLIPYDEHSGDRVELIKAIGIPHTNGRYPLGLTPRYGVERILPNHYLDLSDFRTVRHWPKQPLGEVASVKEVVAEIATLIKRNITAVVAATPTYLRLTAGQDSRVLLACARTVADQLELVTFRMDDNRAAIDCDTARRIAKRLGLKHRVLADKATEEDLEEWMFRISYSTGELRGCTAATMLKQLTGGHAMFVENVGELARAYWSQSNDSESTVVPPERLVELCECPPDEEQLVERARTWLETVPAATASRILDLFYLEQDLGCWAGVVHYTECDPGFTLFPLCHRGIIERMLTLPAEYRRSGRLPRDIIAREWPALLEWPINQPSGATRLLFGVKRAISKGARLLRHPERLPN
jgi:hypothetical protein